MHISIAAEHLFDIWGLRVTNTMLTSWLVVIFLVVISVLIRRAMEKKPNGKVAIAVESILDGFIGFMSAFAGDKKTVRKFLPIVAGIFFYVLTANWAGTLPGIETIGINQGVSSGEHASVDSHGEEIAVEPKEDSHGEESAAATDDAHGSEGRFLPLFRTVNSDLNMTLILAAIIVIGSHIVGFTTIGAKHHLGKFFVNPFKKPIGFFVGILELIGELSRLISLTFRLFGNIFAGSVLMLIISFLAPFFVPIPFLGLELFVGFVQALVISVLAVMFLASATHMHEEH
ncbi:MAG TPA: F0F1 ATP synthase subunit A [Candidatus Paceibacterota bacterium]|nr:F0F1 ATP synthase subunit A [Candidatus Paceibacterota bacterium]